MKDKKTEIVEEKIEIEEINQEQESENLSIYNKVKSVPDKAQKKINGGRLNGMTDIKPMWRIEKLTEIFGICGFGWKTFIKNKEIIEGANGEKIAIVDIDLYIKNDKGEWSEPIEGTGGSSFIAKERNGLYTNDECFKMAYTDALSVACKSLGMGADIYWGDSKYNQPKEMTKEEAEKYTINFGKHKGKLLIDLIKEENPYIDWLLNNSNNQEVLKAIELLTGRTPKTEEEWDERMPLTLKLVNVINEKGLDVDKICEYYKVKTTNELSDEQIKEIIEKRG